MSNDRSETLDNLMMLVSYLCAYVRLIVVQNSYFSIFNAGIVVINGMMTIVEIIRKMNKYNKVD